MGFQIIFIAILSNFQWMDIRQDSDAIFDLRALSSFSGHLSELKGPENTRNQSSYEISIG